MNLKEEKVSAKRLHQGQFLFLQSYPKTQESHFLFQIGSIFSIPFERVHFVYPWIFHLFNQVVSYPRKIPKLKNKWRKG